jgi:hypothetical protein
VRQKAWDISSEAEAWGPGYPNIQENLPGQRHVAIVLGFTPTKKPLNATVSVLQSNHRKQTGANKMIKQITAIAALLPMMAAAQLFNPMPMPMPQMVQPSYGIQLNTQVQQRQQAEMQAYRELQQQYALRQIQQQQQAQQLQQLNQRSTGWAY